MLKCQNEITRKGKTAATTDNDYEENQGNPDLIKELLKYKERVMSVLVQVKGEGFHEPEVLTMVAHNVLDSERGYSPIHHLETREVAILKERSEWDDGWTRVSIRKRTPVWEAAMPTRDETSVTTTVVLKPLGKHGTKIVTSRVVCLTFKDAGFPREDGFRAYYQERPKGAVTLGNS